MNKLEEIHDAGLLPLEPTHVELLLKYRPITLLLHEFHVAMRQSHRKDIEFPHTQLRELLKAVGHIAEEKN